MYGWWKRVGVDGEEVAEVEDIGCRFCYRNGRAFWFRGIDGVSVLGE